MSKIWVIIAGHGEYSGRSERVLCAVSSEEKAKSLDDQLNKLQEFNKEFHKRIYNEFEQSYLIEHPKPIAPIHPAPPNGLSETQDAVAKAKLAKNLTQELSDKNKALSKEHNANLKIYNELYNKYTKQKDIHEDNLLKARMEWVSQNYNPPAYLNDAKQFMSYTGESRHASFNNDYNYYDVELIEENK